MQKTIIGTLLIFLLLQGTCLAVRTTQENIRGFDEKLVQKLNNEIRKLHRRIDVIMADDVTISDLATSSDTIYDLGCDSNGKLYRKGTL